jgi:CHAT domain
MKFLKVLFLAANPTGMKPLLLDKEIREISAKIRASDHPGSIDLESRWAVRPDDLLQALHEEKPHIVHFSGHGSHTNELFLEDDDGSPKPVSTDALVQVFRALKDNVRVVVFNACSTAVQAESLAKVIDCVIGMNQPVSDDAAIVFAASFYRALGFGRSVREAFEIGKAALLLEGIPEHETPELHVRGGVDPSSLALVAPQSAFVSAAALPLTFHPGDWTRYDLGGYVDEFHQGPS